MQRRYSVSAEGILSAAVLAALTSSLQAQQRFAPGPGVSPIPSPSRHGFEVGDLDGDGDLDVVRVLFHAGAGGIPHGTPIGNQILVNDGFGGLTQGVGRITQDPSVLGSYDQAIGDLDGDGLNDLVFSGGGVLSWLRQHPNGQFPAAASIAGPGVRGVLELGDVDGDGDQDILLGVCWGQNRLYLNDGTGAFTDVTASQLPQDLDGTLVLRLGDVDGDGDPDLVVGNGGTFSYYYPYPYWVWGRDRLCINDGAGVFIDATASRLPPSLSKSTDLELGDLDGDGDLDLVIAKGVYYTGGGGTGVTRSWPNEMLLNNGAGVFRTIPWPSTSHSSPVSTTGGQQVELGDVDGDGDVDVVVGGEIHPIFTYYGSSSFADLLLNDGSASFTSVGATEFGRVVPGLVRLADLDGDQDLDVLFGRHDSGTSGTVQNDYVLANLEREFRPTGAARVGQAYQFELHARGAQAGALVLPYVSTASATVPAPPVGVVRLDLSMAAALPWTVVPPSGQAAVSIAVPNDPAFVGVTVYGQALFVHDAGGAPRAVLSRATAGVIR